MKNTLNKRLDKVEKLFMNFLEEKQKLDFPSSCIFCVADGKQKEEIYKQNLSSSWVISCDLVLQYYKEKGLKTCDHKNRLLVNESISLTDKISHLLETKSNDARNSLKLFKVLGDYLYEDNAPAKLQKIIDTVGKEWIKSLNPFDYDFGYLQQLKEHGDAARGGLSIPPNHPHIYRTQREWAKVCDCEGCKEYWVNRKNKIKQAEKELQKN